MLKIHTKENINFFLNKWKSTGFKHFNDSKAFLEHSNNMDDIYKNIEE